MSARAFNQDVSGAKRAAAQGPVVVTDRGEPTFVLMSIEEYRRLTQEGCDEFPARLRMDEPGDVEFPPLRPEPRTPDP